jgi:DegV family protein with EDD domain
MRTAIITDTNSGMLPEDAAEHGIFLLPMPIIIDGREYLEHIDITPDQFYARQLEGAEIHTSQPSAGDVIDLWEKLLKDYDEVVHIPMSSSLSGSCQSAQLYARDFGGRVHVVDNQRISVTQRQSALDAKALADGGASGAEIRRILEETKAESHIYIMVDTLKYLKKGGRITPAAATIAGVLNIKPVLQIQGGKLDAFAKCRGVKSAKKTIIRAVTDGVVNEFGGLDAPKPGAWLGFAYTHNHDAAETFLAEAKEAFPGFDIHADELPMSIATHVGPGSLAMTCTKVLPGGVQYA